MLEIQKKVIPAITDEWVTKHMPMYKSADDFRNSIRESLEKQGREQYDDYNRQLAASELARRFQGSIADEVYEAMREQLMNNVRQTAQQQGKTLDAFIEEQGGQQQFGMMMMMQIRELLVQGFALDALFPPRAPRAERRRHQRRLPRYEPAGEPQDAASAPRADGPRLHAARRLPSA